jgi:hypothetical protein
MMGLLGYNPVISQRSFVFEKRGRDSINVPP